MNRKNWLARSAPIALNLFLLMGTAEGLYALGKTVSNYYYSDNTNDTHESYSNVLAKIRDAVVTPDGRLYQMTTIQNMIADPKMSKIGQHTLNLVVTATLKAQDAAQNLIQTKSVQELKQLVMGIKSRMLSCASELKRLPPVTSKNWDTYSRLIVRYAEDSATLEILQKKLQST